jgi:hypothetical protein
LPTIALGIGVVVAGLGIGAFLSAVQNQGIRATGRVPSTAQLPAAATATPGLPVVTPVPRATRDALARATPRPHATSAPSPSPPSPPTPARAAVVTPLPAAAPKSAAPAAAHSPAMAAPVSTASASAAPTAASAASPPSVRFTPAAVVLTTAAPAFGAQGQATVRRYLGALIAGDENGAYAALGASPGDPNAPLSEEAFVDRQTRITSIRTTRADAGGATVEAELHAARGTYIVTFHVANGRSGGVIDQHDYIRL